MLSFEQIKQLIDIVCERDLGGLEVEETGFRLKIDGPVARGVPSVPLVTGAAVAPAAARPAAPALAVVSAAGEQQQGSVPAAEDGHVINSPIVGTFYSAASPDAEAYVEVGSKVSKGQVLCIVEAMKLMNEIESDVSGEVTKIFPKNAQPVEYGEPLFAIKPD